MSYPTVGFIIPTLGKRPEYLIQCLRSVSDAGICSLVLAGPKEQLDIDGLRSMFNFEFLDTHERNLAHVINLAERKLPASVKYFNWIGDDDLVEPGSIHTSLTKLESDFEVLLVFRDCRYIDESGALLGINQFGQRAISFLRIGPQLIPQPACLIRRTAFNEIGGLCTSYKLAFDFKLILDLSRHGKLAYVRGVGASFRWHRSSLTVESRVRSALEASKARQSVRSKRSRFLLSPLELCVIFGTVISGKIFGAIVNAKVIWRR